MTVQRSDPVDLPLAAGAKPAISVIIPTYNWSTALRCSIRSVLLQTRQDFEVLVVGDGCTDDSEAVVSAFGDTRLRWFNLDRNFGSQWAANNFALEHARADWVAYLGHDDIWYPTHLDSILRTAERRGAEVVTSTAVLYGPPRSGVRWIAGLFASGRFGEEDFVPPSAVAHARGLYPDVIRWRDPTELALPMDAAFLSELAVAERRFATTDELTVFKFNAAWRRDSYRLRPVTEQEDMLARIEDGSDFRQAELIAVLQAFVSGLGGTVTAPAAAGFAKGEIVARNRRFKGAAPRFDPDRLYSIDGPRRFELTEQDMPFEWHGLEQAEDGSTFRWSGPSTCSTIDLPVRFDRDFAIRIGLRQCLGPDSAEEIRLFRGDVGLPMRFETETSGIVLASEARFDGSPHSPNGFSVTIDAGRVRRPADIGFGADTRWLGVAVAWIELSPLG